MNHPELTDAQRAARAELAERLDNAKPTAREVYPGQFGRSLGMLLGFLSYIIDDPAQPLGLMPRHAEHVADHLDQAATQPTTTGYYLDHDAYGDLTLWRARIDDQPYPQPIAMRPRYTAEVWGLLVRGAGIHEQAEQRAESDDHCTEVHCDGICYTEHEWKRRAEQAEGDTDAWRENHEIAAEHLRRIARERDRDTRHHQQEYAALSSAYDELERDHDEWKYRAEQAEARAKRRERERNAYGDGWRRERPRALNAEARAASWWESAKYFARRNRQNWERADLAESERDAARSDARALCWHAEHHRDLAQMYQSGNESAVDEALRYLAHCGYVAPDLDSHDRDISRTVMVTLAAAGYLHTPCDGSAQCPAEQHIQGCFASDPEPHPDFLAWLRDGADGIDQADTTITEETNRG